MSEQKHNLYSLLIYNLPPKIRCSHNKSGAYSKDAVATHIALKSYEFIEYNSKSKCSIVVMDKDKHQDKIAKEFFPTIPDFFDWLQSKISIVPTWITETKKGYQVGFILKHPFLMTSYNRPGTPQRKLSAIKEKYIEHLELDANATNKAKGIFRNPCVHRHIAYPEKVYILDELDNALIDYKDEEKSFSYGKPKSKRRLTGKIVENRNVSLFNRALYNFAGTKPTLKEVRAFLTYQNKEYCLEPLEDNKIEHIAKSIYKYGQQNKILPGLKKLQKNRKSHRKDIKRKIIKFIKKCIKKDEKINISKMAQSIGLSRTQVYSSYKEFIDKNVRLIQ